MNSVEYNGLTLQVNNSVLVNPEGGGKPFVGKIIGIEPGSKVKGKEAPTLTVKWYYRPEEALGGRKSFHGESELFSSDHTDKISARAVEGPALVVSLDAYQAQPHLPPHLFYTRFHYWPVEKRFEPDQVAVYCKCELPYNPDRYMVYCDSCGDWYHPQCLGLTQEGVEAAVAASEAWHCPECEQKGASTASTCLPRGVKAEHEGGST